MQYTFESGARFYECRDVFVHKKILSATGRFKIFLENVLL
jgi:hypothetical protein